MKTFPLSTSFYIRYEILIKLKMSFQERRKEFAFLLAFSVVAFLLFAIYFLHASGSQSKSEEGSTIYHVNSFQLDDMEEQTESEDTDDQNRDNNKFYVDQDLTSEGSTSSSTLEPEDIVTAVKDGECLFYDLLNDLQCNDITNVYECYFDGGDCCKNGATMHLCTECECKGHRPFNCPHEYAHLVANGECDQEVLALGDICHDDGNDCGKFFFILSMSITL